MRVCHGSPAIRFGLVLVVSLSTVFPGLFTPAVAQDVFDDHLWISNKRVQAMERVGDTLYIGGNFTYVGPATGPGASFDAAAGEMKSNLLPVLGYVEVIKPDGDGGWFVGGEFVHTQIPSVGNLIHVAGDGSVTPLPAPNGRVSALLLHGNTLYVGGYFTQVGGAVRSAAAALDVEDPGSSNVLPWHPNVVGGVNALELAEQAIILGGNFQAVSGVPRTHLAAVDPVTAELLPLSLDIQHWVTDVSRLGNTLYVCGVFFEIDGQDRRHIAAIDLESGELLPWTAQPNGAPDRILATGSAVFIAGTLGAVNFVQRNGIAALNPVSAQLLPWNADVFPNNVQDLWLSESTQSLYLAGNFTRVGNVPRHRIAELDLSTAALKPLEIHAGDTVAAIALSGNDLYVGGLFNSAGGIPRMGAAALDMLTGEATDWDMRIQFGSVLDMKSDGDSLFVAGGFLHLGTDQVQRQYVAEVDLGTGEPTEWKPPEHDGVGIHALELTDNYVYIGGGFRLIGGVVQAYLAELDRRTGELSRPFGGIGGIGPRVRDLYYDHERNTLYVGGWFAQLAGVLRHNLAALDVATGTLTGWAPNVFGNTVNALASRGDDTLYVAGRFTEVNGQAIENAAALSKSTGQLIREWNPTPAGGGSETVLAMVATERAVYFGGALCFVGGTQLPGCHGAAVDPASGELLDWFPGTTGMPPLDVSDGWIYQLMLDGGRMYVGGGYLELMNAHRGGISVVSSLEVPAAALMFDPDSLEFGMVEVGATGASLTAVLRNTGKLDAVDLHFDKPGTGFDTDTTSCNDVLTAGESCEIVVTFSAIQPGLFEDVLTVQAESTATAALSLSGTGVDLREIIFQDGFEM
jgi:hypothetical protein